MNWRKIGQICAISYLFLYLAAMVMPRKLPYGQFSSDHANFIKRAFHQILYYGGPLEPVANFLILIPLYLYFITLFTRAKSTYSLFLCIALAGLSEFCQIFIPGRISSFNDFGLNVSGALLASVLVVLRQKILFLKN